MLKVPPKISLLTLVFACSLSACVTQPIEVPASADDLKIISARLIELEQELSKQFTENCSESILDINEKLEQLRRTSQTSDKVEECAAQNNERTTLVTLDDKLLLGSIERVHLPKEELTFDVRIDTGAETSSMGVFNMQNFERDGDKWVKFSLNGEGDSQVYEYPVFDTVKIKQIGALTEDRIEIKMDINMGGIEYKNQIFNLADRAHLDYQILIGRSFLQDIAVVDVARKNLLDGG